MGGVAQLVWRSSIRKDFTRCILCTLCSLFSDIDTPLSSGHAFVASLSSISAPPGSYGV